MLAMIAVSCSVACSELTDPNAALHVPLAAAEVVQVTGVPASGDTYIRSGSPNQNQGSEALLRLQSSGHNRALIRFEPQAISAAVGTGTLQSARLELTITLNANNWGTSGRTIDLHRLTRAWTELGATWNCAVDTNPGDSSADCSGPTSWEMGNAGPSPWAPAPTATTTIRNGQTGVVVLDVTSDVLPLLSGAGGATEGWILKKTEEGQAGHVEFGSRESGNPPRLMLNIQTADTSRPILPPLGVPYPADTLFVVANPADPTFFWYRRGFMVTFADTVSGQTIRSFLQAFEAEVIGGTYDPRPDMTLRVRDPGPEWQAYRDLLAQMHASPGVIEVTPLNRTGLGKGIEARYPNDGSGLERSAWFDSSGTTRALRAIRAPLAWGCETGTYGGSIPRVGLVEWGADTTLSDLQASDPRVFITHPAPGIPEPLPTPMDTAHSRAVAGILTASGDNGIGTAGVTWHTSLRLYVEQGQPSINRFATAYLPGIMADAPHVLNISVRLYGSDTLLIRRAVIGLRDLMQRLPNLLVVVAAGNLPESPRIELSQALNDTTSIVRAALIRLRQESSGFRDRIIVVGGADRVGAIWQGSSFIRGATDIAAPAEGLTVLGAGDQPVTGAFGTSFSAAMVSGVAAQLLTMDPTLTPAQVKDYILRGAQVRRVNAVTGDSIPATPISGAPETIYQLDAYGALTLLSRERQGAPVCGFPVSVRGSHLVLERPVQAESLSLSGNPQLYSPSMAQGGRRFAVTNGANARVSEIDHRGNLLRTLEEGILERRYLERDTVDVQDALSTGGWTRPVFRYRPSRPGIPTDYNPWILALPAAQDDIVGQDWEFDPTGDHIILNATASPTHLETYRIGWYLIDVAGHSGTPIMEWGNDPALTDCYRSGGRFCLIPDQGQATWSHDGRQYGVFIPQREVEPSDGVPFLKYLRLEPGSQRASDSTVAWHTLVLLRGVLNATTTVSGFWLMHPRFHPEDIAIGFRELSTSPACSATSRLVATIAVRLTQSAVPQGECLKDAGEYWPATSSVRLRPQPRHQE